jgi:hypothetical protein
MTDRDPRSQEALPKLLVVASTAAELGCKIVRSQMNCFVAAPKVIPSGRLLRREQVPQIFGTEGRRSVAFVEERRSKLALLLVKLDDALFDGARRNQPIDRDGASLSDAVGVAPQPPDSTTDRVLPAERLAIATCESAPSRPRAAASRKAGCFAERTTPKPEFPWRTTPAATKASTWGRKVVVLDRRVAVERKPAALQSSANVEMFTSPCRPGNPSRSRWVVSRPFARA